MKRYYFLLVSLLFTFSAVAQEIVTLKDGRSIVVYPNGTWVEYNQSANPGETIDYEAVLKQQREKELEALKAQRAEDKEIRDQLKKQKELQKLAEKKARLEQKIIKSLSEGDTLPAVQVPVVIKQEQPKEEQTVLFETENTSVESDCDYAVNEQDAFTGSTKRLTKAEYLLSYSPPGFKEENGGSDKISIGGYLGSMDNAKIFYFSIQIKSTDAYKQYGDIEYRGKLLLKLASGKLVELRSGKEAQANINMASELTSYSTYYLLNEKNMNELAKSPVTNIRMIWSKGYDDFVVDQQDFFLSNLPCIQ